MHQSPLKMPPRQRDRQAEFDSSVEREAERKLQRAAPPKARKFALKDDEPRHDRRLG